MKGQASSCSLGLSISSVGVLLLGVLSFAGSQHAEPFFGTPTLGDMIIYVAVPVLLIVVAIAIAAIGVYQAATRRCNPTVVLSTLPLAAAVWLLVMTMAEYTGDISQHHRELAADANLLDQILGEGTRLGKSDGTFTSAQVIEAIRVNGSSPSHP